MIGRWRRRRARPGPGTTPGPESLFAELAAVRPPEDYGAAERARDFRAVFFGESTPVQGRRVLWQILAWCRLFRPLAAPGDSHETYRRDGERNIGLRLLAVLNAAPDRGTPSDSSNERT